MTDKKSKKPKKQKTFELVSDNWIEKSNALNEIRNNRMNITQIRLLSVYLSKIDPRKHETREVEFTLDEYMRIMQIKEINTKRLVKTAEELLKMVVTYYDRTGEYSSDGLVGFVMCQIFKRFKLYKDNNGEWIVSIDCHDDVLHLMFDLQKYYFTYQLWNALQLTSSNQQRMYEILKQYEKAGERIVTVKDLREWLGIKPEEYPRWERFKVRVLDASQEALARYTDIRFTWEVYGKRGQGGKIKALRFVIEKNDRYIRQLTLNDYLNEQGHIEYEDEPKEFERPDEDGDDRTPYQERIDFFMEACNGEFSFEEIAVLQDKMRERLPGNKFLDQLHCYHYFSDRYKYMELQNKRRKITNRFGYMKSLMDKDL